MNQVTETKQSLILYAALHEFANKGYKKASTNSIVKQAGVSKGLLFHYFISKKELFIKIHQHILIVFNDELNDCVNFEDRDVLERLSKSTVCRTNSYIHHPVFVKFLQAVSNCKDEEIKARCQKQSHVIIQKTYKKLFDNIDYFLFVDNIDVKQSLNVVRWTIERLSNNWFRENGNTYKASKFDDLKSSIETYINLFKQTFYK